MKNPMKSIPFLLRIVPGVGVVWGGVGVVSCRGWSGVGCVMQGWSGVGCVMQGVRGGGGLCRAGVGHVGRWGGVCHVGVGVCHAGVGGHVGVGWVM